MTTVVAAPARADGVQLLGEMAGSGYRTPPSLVRRSDGQTLQLTSLLYLVLEAVDGRRSHAEIAELVSRRSGRPVSEENIHTLVDSQLRPLGLLTLPDGSSPELKRSNPLLALKLKFAVTNPRFTRLLTDPFRPMFSPVVWVPVLLGFLAVTWWVFFDQGLAASAYDAFERPHLLLLVFVVTVLSAGFHEFGHAAAARYGGADPGVIGAGIYLVWPAFYTDVTDSYRLDRRGRIRTDLGGLYFNAVVAVLTFGWWWWTGWDALLLLVATQILQMVQQLLPLLRFDGYHVLADLAGVPDLYQRIRPTLAGLLPHRWFSGENRMLKPWSRALITLWVLVTIPLMALMLFALVKAVPRLLGTAWAALREDTAVVAAAWADGSPIDVAGESLRVAALVLPVLATALILGRIGVRWFAGFASWSRGSILRRAVAALASTVLVTGLVWAWWPNPGTYRPIGPDERGLLTEVLPVSSGTPVGAGVVPTQVVLPVGSAAKSRLAGDEPLVAAFPEDRPLPTRRDPQLAMVLVPADGSPAPEGAAGPGDGSAQEPWVFPFDEPLPPGEGDNQAMAVNTTDGSTRYDVAFAMVWADGNEVLNTNEAYAFASCNDCVTVAVAYQVVFIMDDAQVIVPQNLAGALNYDCYRCITAAIANQLVLSVSEQPGEEELRALGAVWAQLIQFGASITQYSMAEIAEQLDRFSAAIIDILGEAPEVGTATGSATASASPSGSATGSASGSPSGSSSPSGSTSGGTSGSATPSPTAEAEPSPTAEPEPTPESTPAPEPTTAPETSSPEPTGDATSGSTSSGSTGSGSTSSGESGSTAESTASP